MTEHVPLNQRLQSVIRETDLYGVECPVCGVEMTRGSVRFEGDGWAHKNPEVHAQAGHHRFDAVAAVRGDGGD